MGNGASNKFEYLPYRRIHISFPKHTKYIKLLQNEISNYELDISYTANKYNAENIKKAEFILILLTETSVEDIVHVNEIQTANFEYKNILYLITENTTNNFKNLIKDKNWLFFNDINDFHKLEQYIGKHFCTMEHKHSNSQNRQ